MSCAIDQDVGLRGREVQGRLWNPHFHSFGWSLRCVALPLSTSSFAHLPTTADQNEQKWCFNMSSSVQSPTRPFPTHLVAVLLHFHSFGWSLRCVALPLSTSSFAHLPTPLFLSTLHLGQVCNWPRCRVERKRGVGKCAKEEVLRGKATHRKLFQRSSTATKWVGKGRVGDWTEDDMLKHHFCSFWWARRRIASSNQMNGNEDSTDDLALQIKMNKSGVSL
jgi:hypothetical protein